MRASVYAESEARLPTRREWTAGSRDKRYHLLPVAALNVDPAAAVPWHTRWPGADAIALVRDSVAGPTWSDVFARTVRRRRRTRPRSVRSR